MSGGEGFIMDSRAAMLFFRTCKLYKIKERTDRLRLLGSIAKRGKAAYIRDTDPFLKGKRVIHVKDKTGGFNAN